MKKLFLLLFAGCFLNCPPNPSHIIYPIIFHFQSDIVNLGLNNLQVVLTANNTGTIYLDSNSFFICPTNNDTCDGRIQYYKIQNYTIKVPMTKVIEFTAEDSRIDLLAIIKDTTDILLKTNYSFQPTKPGMDVLIYLGNGYDENQQKIKDFITVVKSNLRKNPIHVSFPIDGTPASNDSLFLVWLN